MNQKTKRRKTMSKKTQFTRSNNKIGSLSWTSPIYTHGEGKYQNKILHDNIPGYPGYHISKRGKIYSRWDVNGKGILNIKINMKNKKLILLVDGENILHQSFHKFEKLKSTDGKPSGAIFGFFRSLHGFLHRWDPDEVIITFDNGHSPYRDALLPDYKGHRKNISVDYESLQSQKRIIMGMLKLLRIKYVFDKHNSTKYEGDDFLAYLVLNKKPTEKVIIISSDKDFNQLIGKDVKINNPRKDEMIHQGNCKELFGYSPEETVDYLSMVGDTSDDIKGIPGIGPVKARKILDEYGTLDKFLEHHHQTSHVEIAERNKKLIDLRLFQKEVPLSKLPMKKFANKEIKYKKFKEVCIEYSLASFMTNEFMKPFKDLLS